jgi:zinc transporter
MNPRRRSRLRSPQLLILGYKLSAIGYSLFFMDAMAILGRGLSEKIFPPLWTTHQARFREEAYYFICYVDNFDAARKRMGVMQEELTDKLSDQMNKTMYILTVLAGIFLPIPFVTGLLGINVGGTPGSEDPWAFTMVCLTLTSAGLLLVGIFRWLKWL